MERALPPLEGGVAVRERLRKVGPLEQSARRAGSQAIDPRNRVLVIRARFVLEREVLVEAPEPDSLHLQTRARDAHELDLHPRDQAREAHPADRRTEEFGVLLGRTLPPAAVRAPEFEAADVAAERSRAVVVLAVDVVRDRTAERDELGARADRQEPTARNDHREQLLEAEPRLGAQDPSLRIEVDQSRELAGVDQHPAVVQAAIAVAAAEPVGEGGRRPEIQIGQLAAPVEADGSRTAWPFGSRPQLW